MRMAAPKNLRMQSIYAAKLIKPFYGENVKRCLCNRKKAMQVAQLVFKKYNKMAVRPVQNENQT